MNCTTKYRFLLICSGLVVIVSFSLPWTNHLTFLQLLGSLAVSEAFPRVPLEFAGSDSQRVALYATLYTGFLSSSFLIATGMLQRRDRLEEFWWIRLLSITLYAGAILTALHYPALPPQIGDASYGFYLFVGWLPVLAFAEYKYGDHDALHRVLNVRQNHHVESEQAEADSVERSE